MNKLKKELIDKIVNRETIPFNAMDNYWVIVINDRIFAPTHGTCFFESSEKAWRCWYTQTNYGIKWSYRNDIAKQAGFDKVWEYKGNFPMTSRNVWDAFKAQLYEDYGLKIIQWKDAKRDVCGESNA